MLRTAAVEQSEHSSGILPSAVETEQAVRPWDDGTDLGNYNTQQYRVTHSRSLFLVYTRKGAHNDHVFRHRAPLFIAQVAPESLRVIRRTERVLVPERGARLGNFGVTEVSDHETWVTVAEWVQANPPKIVSRSLPRPLAELAGCDLPPDTGFYCLWYGGCQQTAELRIRG